MGLGDFDFSARLKEAIYQIAAQAVDDAYPRPRYATVTAVNLLTKKATVVYPDDATTFTVSITVVAPSVGSVVRIAGQPGTRYVDEVMTGAAYFLNGAESRRNLIDNGAMNVHQRVTPVTGINSVNGVRVTDRWWQALSGGPIWTVSNEVDAPAGTGLTNSHKWLCTTASASPAAGEFSINQQGIEGQFLQHLLWGTANAKPVVLQFWVKSNTAGTYILEVAHNDNVTTNAISIPYTVAGAGAWEYKTVSVPGNTALGIYNDSSGRFYIEHWLEAGSSYKSGTLASAWQVQTAANRAVGQTNLAAAINNYWQITGAQLEIGTVSTPFEIRSYDDELRRCFRYFYESTKVSYSTIPSSGVVTAATTASVVLYYPERMRAAPAISSVGSIRLIDQYAPSGYAVTALADAGSGQTTQDAAYVSVTCGGGGMTGGRVVFLQGNGDATAAIRLSAEI